MIRLPPISTLFPLTTLFRSRYSPAGTVATRARLPLTSSRASAGSEPSITNVVKLRCSTLPAASCSRSRSEEHTFELQSRQYLVCRLLLEKKEKLHNQTPCES